MRGNIHSFAAIEAPHDLVAGRHDGNVRDAEADADTVSAGPLEQKTEPWVAVRNPHEVSDDDKRAAPRAAAKNTAGRPNRSLRDIIVPASHAGVDVEQVFAPGMSEAVGARTVPRSPRARFPAGLILDGAA
jgi:hypothetical protein